MKYLKRDAVPMLVNILPWISPSVFSYLFYLQFLLSFHFSYLKEFGSTSQNSLNDDLVVVNTEENMTLWVNLNVNIDLLKLPSLINKSWIFLSSFFRIPVQTDLSTNLKIKMPMEIEVGVGEISSYVNSFHDNCILAMLFINES